MDWEGVARQERAREHGTEPAFADVDDLTPEERRERRRPVSEKARQIVSAAKAEMEALVRRYVSLEIPERDRRRGEFRAALDKVTRTAINRLPVGTNEAAGAEIREHLSFALSDIGPPPSPPKSRVQAPGHAKTSPQPLPKRQARKRKIFAQKKALTVSVSLGRVAGSQRKLLCISWESDATIDEWLVIVKKGNAEVARRKVSAGTHEIEIEVRPREAAALRVLVFGIVSGRTVTTGWKPVQEP